MKYLLSILCLFVFSCSPLITISDLDSKGQEIQNKIKKLQIGLASNSDIIRNENLSTLAIQDGFSSIFERTLEKNIFENGIESWGYIELKSTYYDFYSDNSILGFLGVPPFPILALFAVPFRIERLTMQFDVNIYNNKKQKIKSYTFSIEEKNNRNLYNSKRINVYDYFQDIMRELELKINNDADYINSQLNAIISND